MHNRDLFRGGMILGKNSQDKKLKLDFLNKNYTTKCDFCCNLCIGYIYSLKEKYLDLNNEDENNSSPLRKDTIVICEKCFKNENFPKDINREMFQKTYLKKLLAGNPEETEYIKKFTDKKWTLKETYELLDLLGPLKENIEIKNFEWNKVLNVFKYK